MKNKKKKIIITVIGIIFVICITILIYKLSGMNSNKSNGHSVDYISIFIEDTLDITNKYDITSSNPSPEKLLRAAILLNKPLRKVMHALVYFILGIVIIFFTNYLFDNKRYWLSFIITMFAIVILASFDEYHLTFVDGRTGQFKDVIIDSLGALVGLLFYGSYYLAYRLGIQNRLHQKINN